MAVFGKPLLQVFHLLRKPRDLLLLQTDILLQSLDQFFLRGYYSLLQAYLLSQQAILFSELDQFFFCCYALTLQSVGLFGKLVVDLSSYKNSLLLFFEPMF